MRTGHIPYGYRIEAGKAAIDEQESRKLQILFDAVIYGYSYHAAAEIAGIVKTHSAVKLLLRNQRYLGDDFYPAIVSKETFDAAELELQRRKAAHRAKASDRVQRGKVGQTFLMKQVENIPEDPFERAAYLFNLIDISK